MRQMLCKPERLRAIVDDTRKLMEGINRLTSFLVDEARATLWQRETGPRTCYRMDATCNVQHLVCDLQHATKWMHLATRNGRLLSTGTRVRAHTVSNRRPSARHRGKAARM